MIREETHQAALAELLQLPGKAGCHLYKAADRLSTTTLSLLRTMKITIPCRNSPGGLHQFHLLRTFSIHPLTSVVQPALEMGQLATEMLLYRLSKAAGPSRSLTSGVMDNGAADPGFQHKERLLICWP